jgi:hypothetical protein
MRETLGGKLFDGRMQFQDIATGMRSTAKALKRRGHPSTGNRGN